VWGAAQQRILALFKRFDDEARVLKHSESIAKDRAYLAGWSSWWVNLVGCRYLLIVLEQGTGDMNAHARFTKESFHKRRRSKER